jgi:SAM-dependent methyltransferase
MENQFPPEAFRRQDESPDEKFYEQPRFVTHIDDGAIAAVTQLYREYFKADSAILDLMSSWISHLPTEISFRRVAGLGMNREELARNKRLTDYVVQNLNTNSVLPFGIGEFDGAGCVVSIDYLVKPIDVLREVGRVLKPSAPFVITFSNRCFPTKATAAWLYTDDDEHLKLVASYLRAAENWTDIELLNRSPKRGDPLYAVVGRSMGRSA